MIRSRLADCRIHDLPKHAHPRGNLTFIEGSRHVPFEIKRIFYLYGLPTEESRGSHAHRTLHQFMICLAGGFDVRMEDGTARTTTRLNRPWKGLHVSPMIWASEGNFDPGTVCLVLVSDVYNPADYIRAYDEYLRLAAGGGG